MLMDTFTSTRGPGSKIHDPLEQEVNALYRKRRLISGPEDSFGMMGGGPSLPKKSKMPDYYVADLVHIVALCKDRIPLVNLGNEVCDIGKLFYQISILWQCVLASWKLTLLSSLESNFEF